MPVPGIVRANAPGKKEGEGAKAMTFLAYKAGMVHIIGTDAHEGGIKFGRPVSLACTVLECPPMKVFGVRAYKKANYGIEAALDVLVEKPDKSVHRRMKNLKKPLSKKKKDRPAYKNIAEIEAIKDSVKEIRLLAHTSPGKTGIGKKKPEITEVMLSGSVEEQLAYAKGIMGGEIKAADLFAKDTFVDVKAVDKGKGTTGIVKRFGTKTHRHKAKHPRILGSLGPWTPSTVMWTVPRAGQHGYQNRTELNKRVLVAGDNPAEINPSAGFKNYGVVKNDYLVVAGSVPGPAKRCVAVRGAIRPYNENQNKISEISFISSGAPSGKHPYNRKAKEAPAKEEPKKEGEPKKTEGAQKGAGKKGAPKEKKEEKPKSGENEGKPKKAEGASSKKGAEKKNAPKKEAKK